MLVFIDESGYPTPNDPCTRPVLCAVCLPKEYCRTLTGVLFNLKKTLYGIPPDPSRLIEVHGHKFLTRSTFRRAKLGTPAERAVKLLEGTMDACQNIFLSMRVFAVIMHKPEHIPFYEQKHLAREYVYLLQRISLYMDHHHANRMATVIFDEQDLAADMQRAFAFGQYVFTSAEGKTFRRILDTPFFIASQTSPGLQVADIFSRALRLYYEEGLEKKENKDPFELAISRYVEIAFAKTENLHNPITQQDHFGIYEMPLRLFPPPKQ